MIQGLRMVAVAAVVALLLCGNSRTASAGNIDDVYQRESDDTWGRLFSSLFGQINGIRFGKSYALIIAISDYEYLTPIEAAESDAERMRNFLINEESFDYVVTLTNGAATKSRIDKLMLETFPALIEKGDRFVFYYSGHGTQWPLPAGGFTGYLPLMDSESGSLSTMISMDDIAKWDRFIGDAQHVLFILDACFSGLAGIQSKSDMQDKKLDRLSQYGHFLLTAGTKDEESAASLAEWNGSLFTDSLLRGARGAADSSNAETDADGVISLKELMNYIEGRIDKESARLGKGIKMSPQMSQLSSDNAGEFFFIHPRALESQDVPGAPGGSDIEEKSGATEQASLDVPDVGLSPMSKDYVASGEIPLYRTPNYNDRQVTSVKNGEPFHVSGRVLGEEYWYGITNANGDVIGYAFLDLPDEPVTIPTAPPSVYLVLFDYDKYSINEAANAVIQQIVADFRQSHATSVSIVGHTDRSGTDEYNLRLSERMANAVANALIANGISADAITVAAKGESENAVPTVDGVKEQANRRVEVIIQ